MFGLVSKKKYRELEERCRTISEELNSKCGAYWEKIGKEDLTLNRLNVALKRNLDLATEIEEYKRKFADELQKRLELAERVLELEKHLGRSVRHKEGEG